MNVSILMPSRNGLEFLQWSYNSIRKNQFGHDVEILILDDFSDKDDTWNWLKSLNDKNLKIFRNEGPNRWGISGGYKFLSSRATKDVICHWHNDMFMTEGTLDAISEYLFTRKKIHGVVGQQVGQESYLKPNLDRVVCLTRIEPPIYGKGPEKLIWENGPIELEDWNEDTFLKLIPAFNQMWGGKTTEGHFAPFFMFREEYLKLSGNDTETFPLQSREDSDWAFRLVLAGFKTIQIPHFTYHFASRGNRRSKHETNSFIDNPKWTDHNIKATRNFIRKWQTFNLHDEYLKPIRPSRYNIGFVTGNLSYNLLYNLEPWCDEFVVEIEPDIIDRYIEFEQPNTKFNLRDKINPKQRKKIPDVIVRFSENSLTQDDLIVLQHLSEILTDSGEENSEMEIGNLRISIGKLARYENDLIVCQK